MPLPPAQSGALFVAECVYILRGTNRSRTHNRLTLSDVRMIMIMIVLGTAYSSGLKMKLFTYDFESTFPAVAT